MNIFRLYIEYYSDFCYTIEKRTFERKDHMATFMEISPYQIDDNTFEMIGRVIAGGFHYKHRLPKDKKLPIAFTVYLYIAVVGGKFLKFTIFFAWLKTVGFHRSK